MVRRTTVARPEKTQAASVEGDVRINDNPFELGRLPHRSTLHLRYFHTAECGKSLVNALAEIVTEWRLS